MDFYRVNYEKTKNEISEENVYFIINSPMGLLEWLEKLTDKEKMKKIFCELDQCVHKTWDLYNKETPSPYLNMLLSIWCTETLKYLSTREEKESIILNLLLKKQIPTYLHSVMVKNLSNIIFEYCYRDNPELFKSLNMEFSSIQDFISKCALFHDIGKTRITDIINLQGRRLSESEFLGIKHHPNFGYNMIKDDGDLEVYKDVILYHHKYYNGAGGYPDLDNTKSKYRIIVDIITIADCMDAATDYLGRNYKKNKNASMFFEELKKDSGIRYNPDIVNIIISNQSLKEELTKITEQYRKKLMYDAYISVRINKG